MICVSMTKAIRAAKVSSTSNCLVTDNSLPWVVAHEYRGSEIGSVEASLEISKLPQTY